MTLFDVKSKSSLIWSKLRRNLRAHKFRLEMCGASQYKPHSAEIHSTCIRPRGCVCGSTFSDGRTRANNTSQFQFRAAARGLALCPLIPSCLGISGHSTGSRQGHPRYTGPISGKGRGWPEHSSAQQITV